MSRNMNTFMSLSEYVSNGLKARETIDITQVENFAKRLHSSLTSGGKLITFGNGGSAADAQHFVGELDGHFTAERNALPAIALTTNTSSLTAIGNDYTYEDIFSRPVSALSTEKDVVLGISTSGNSSNVIKAIQAGKENGAYTVALTGKTGGKLRDIVDELFAVNSDFTPIIQEVHISIIHMVCLELDRIMTSPPK